MKTSTVEVAEIVSTAHGCNSAGRNGSAPDRSHHVAHADHTGHAGHKAPAAAGKSGLIAIADAVRPTSRATMAKLQERGVKVAMMTGDNFVWELHKRPGPVLKGSHV